MRSIDLVACVAFALRRQSFSDNTTEVRDIKEPARQLQVTSSGTAMQPIAAGSGVGEEVTSQLKLLKASSHVEP